MNPSPIHGRAADRLTFAFYGTVIAIAGVGCATAAVRWSDWPIYVILPAVAVLELSALALLARADYRRRLGERAVAYRTLAVAVGSLAIGINVFGHLPNNMMAAFFGGFSALGLGMALLMSGDRRRDHLRATGNLPPTAPVYGLWQWARYPAQTWRARTLALRSPGLGLYGSLQAAQDEVRTQARHAALVDLLGKALTNGKDDLAAKVAVTTLDMDEVARRFKAAADYDAVVQLLWSRAPIGAADETATEPTVVTAEIVADPTPIPAGRGHAVRRLDDRDARRVITAVAKAEPGVSTKELGRLGTRSPRTAREILAAEKTSDKPAPSGMGFTTQ